MNYEEEPFIDYLNKVDELLKDQYGVTTNDVGVDLAASCQEDGWSPEECVEWISKKYDIKKLDNLEYRDVTIKVPVVRESTETTVRTPEDAALVCDDLKGLAQEVFAVLCLNARNLLIARNVVTVGLVDASLVHPREVFREAIRLSASAVILGHCHPSGDTSPSPEDIRITKQMIEAGRIVDIKVLDHVIIGEKPLSMREEGLIKF